MEPSTNTAAPFTTMPLCASAPLAELSDAELLTATPPLVGRSNQLGPQLTPDNFVEVLALAKHRTKKELARLARRLDPLPEVPSRIEPIGPAPSRLVSSAPTWSQSVAALYPIRELDPGARPRDWMDWTQRAGTANDHSSETRSDGGVSPDEPALATPARGDASRTRAGAGRRGCDASRTRAGAGRRQSDTRWRGATRMRRQSDTRWRGATRMRRQSDTRWRGATRMRRQSDTRWRGATPVGHALARGDASRTRAGAGRRQSDTRWRGATPVGHALARGDVGQTRAGDLLRLLAARSLDPQPRRFALDRHP